MRLVRDFLANDHKIESLEDDVSTAVALKTKTNKPPNTEKRKVSKTRDYLTPDEVEKLMAAAARLAGTDIEMRRSSCFRIGMGCGCRNWWHCDGITSTSRLRCCMSTATKMVSPLYIHCAVLNFGRYAD